jgi:uncharacterized protein YaeQ
VALTSTVYACEIDLADHDRQVYETLSLRVARHPSESEEYLWTRLLAYAVEYADGIAFSPGGLSDPDEPAIAVRDLTGGLRAWIEVGLPEAGRLHRAMKTAPRVAVYTHRDPGQWLKRLEGERIHRAGALEIYAIDRPLIASLVPRLDRRLAFALSLAERELHVSIGADTLTGLVSRLPIV